MGRAPRPLAPGLTYHVAARGNNGRTIYVGAADRRRFLRMLGRVATRRKWSVVAYCLMGNHFHLLVTTDKADLSDGMRELLGGYARSFNVEHQQKGHLFSQRYLSVVVNTDRQLAIVSRYIARNPVRAGLCSHPRDWEWSSHALLSRHAALPEWCEVDVLLAQFHRDRDRALELLIDFAEDGRLDDPAGIPPEALAPVARRVPSLAVLRLLMPPNEIIVTAAKLGYSHREIGDALEISATAVSQRAYRHRGRRYEGSGGS